MKKVKKIKVKRYASGTQLVSNTDPTTLYSTNRQNSIKDTEFNNSQQAQSNQDLTKLGYNDKFNSSLQNVSQNTSSRASAQGTIQGVAGAINPLYGAAYGVASKVGNSFSNKASQNEVNTGKADTKNNFLSSVTTDTGSKLLSAKSGNDVLNAFVPFLGVNSTTAAKDALKANYNKKRQDYANGQIANYGAIDTTVQNTQLKSGTSGIHIKPENKGKFNALKARTGKSTEELTHSKNPLTRKRAIFAQNAAKWKHEDGSKDITLDNLIKIHELPYNQIEKKEGTKIEKDELKEFKKLKKYETSKLKSGTRMIETEGREPIFSPKKSDGSRDLLYYNPNAPTHKEGGVKALVTKTNKFKVNGLLNIPEGSAIVTANKGKNKEAINAYKKGDVSKLEKVIKQMPSDKSNKKAGGTSNLLDPSNKYNPYGKLDPNQSNPSDKWGNVATQDLDFSNSNQVTSTTNTNNTGSKLNNYLLEGVQAAPSLYNLGRGLYDKPYKTNRRYINNQSYQYQDLSAPSKRAANEAYLMDSQNIRNATGGAGATYLANQNLASANRFKNLSDINNQQAELRMNINNTNTDLRNQQNSANLNLANQYDDMDLQNRARKNDFIGSGLTGLSDLAYHKQRDANMVNADNIRLQTLQSNNYRYDPNKGYMFKSKKGIKNIKTKKK
jgi:hypothetical protein